MSGARMKLIESMQAEGWSLFGQGMMGELWRHPDGRQVAIPYDVTPANWEWAGIVARVHA